MAGCAILRVKEEEAHMLSIIQKLLNALNGTNNLPYNNHSNKLLDYTWSIKGVTDHL